MPDVKVDVIGQCKKESKATGAGYIRELEVCKWVQYYKPIDICFTNFNLVIINLQGTLSQEQAGTVGLLVSHRGYTVHALRHVHLSKYPVILCIVDDLLHLTLFKLSTVASSQLNNLVVRSKSIKVSGDDGQKHKKIVALLYNSGNDISPIWQQKNWMLSLFGTRVGVWKVFEIVPTVSLKWVATQQYNSIPQLTTIRNNKLEGMEFLNVWNVSITSEKLFVITSELFFHSTIHLSCWCNWYKSPIEFMKKSGWITLLALSKSVAVLTPTYNTFSNHT